MQASLPSNPAAARLYAEGLAKLRLYDAQAARTLLDQAVSADPKLPLAHSALAFAWSALGYDERARQSARRAYELSASLAREDRMWVEGRYHDAMNEHEEAIKTYQALYSFFPDNLEYGLQLASGADVRRQGSGRAGDDRFVAAPPGSRCETIRESTARRPRAASSLSDYKRQQVAAARAVAKGRQQGARLLVAGALLTEGNAWQELGDAPKAIAACRGGQTDLRQCRRPRRREPCAPRRWHRATVAGRPGRRQADVRTRRSRSRARSATEHDGRSLEQHRERAAAAGIARSRA